MDHVRLRAGAGAAALCALAFSQPVAALQMTFSDGRPGYIESINSVTYGKAMAKIRWNDALGNVRRAVVGLTPVASKVASFVPKVVSGRLIVSMAVAGVLTEAMIGSINHFYPGTIFDPNGVAARPSSAPSLKPCEGSLLQIPDADGVKHASYAYVPCYLWASAPTRLVMRLPSGDTWQPDPAWFNQYGNGTDTYRDVYAVAQTAPALSVRGMRELTRFQPEKTLDVPADPTPLTGEELKPALMDPATLGVLAANDALPDDLWEPVDAATLEADPETSQPGEGESTLPQDTTMTDVSRSIIDVREWFTPDAWGWLPRSCSLPGPITPIARFPEWRIDFSQYQNSFCPMIATYVVPASDLTAIIIFLTLVLRVRTGGA
ncbi:hypothetical protein ACK3Z8_11860 [Aeromonas caviae]